MTQATDKLWAYIPMDRRQALLHDQRLPEHVIGTALIIDISGFTQMTALLARELGRKAGAEVLLSHINPVYDRLIGILHQYQGCVLSFAGDALTCWFDDGAERAALRAYACTLSMFKALSELTTISVDTYQFTLQVKMAMATGAARRFLVGDPKINLIEVLAGTTLTLMAKGEQLAKAGDLIVDQTTWSLLQAEWSASLQGEWLVRSDEAHQFVRVTAPQTKLKQFVLPDGWSLTQGDVDLEHLASWSLPTIRQRLLSEQTIIEDLRPVTPLFLRFEGIDYDDDPAASAKLDRFVRWVQGVVAQFEGSTLALIIGDKGSYLYAAFGAPIAHEDDIERALHAALLLQQLPHDMDYLQNVQIGLSRGEVWAGRYGSDARHTYGIMGSDVNLSARLMNQAGAGEILVSARMYAPQLFQFSPLGDITYKGFDDPIPTYQLLREADADDGSLYTMPLVGRQKELGQLASATDPLWHSASGGVIVVYGEAGMGKSHLCYALRQQLRDRVNWFTAAADPILHQAFNPFVRVLRQRFGQLLALSADDNKHRFEETLRLLSARLDAAGQVALRRELERIYSVLGAWLDLHWPDSLYDSLDAQSRYEHTVSAFVHWLVCEATLQPTILELEDGHWLDDASAATLQRLTAKVMTVPLLIVITSRYKDDGSQPVYQIAEESPLTVLDLATLTADGLRALATTVLEGPIHDDLYDLLWHKTNANPFFAQQILYYLRENDLLLQADGVWQAAKDDFDLPTTLNTILVARLDRLQQAVKQVVQTAAVLGREFELRILYWLMTQDVKSVVAAAAEEQIWLPLNEATYLFKHALLHNAAYEMQLRAQLVALHELAGRAYETLYVADLKAYYVDLAYHYGQAGQLAKEFDYCWQAGELLAEQGTGQAAINYFNRALVLANELDLANEVRQKIYLRRGRVWELMHEYDKAFTSYVAMGELAEQLDDRSLFVAAMFAQTIIHITFTPYFNPEKGQKLADQSLSLAQEIGDKQTEGKILWGLMLTYGLAKTDFERALPYGQQSLALIEQTNDSEQLGMTLNDLGRLTGFGGDLVAGQEMMLAARPLLKQTNNLPILIDNYHGYSFLAAIAGDFIPARESAQLAIDLSQKINNLFGYSNGLWFASLIDLQQGKFQQALEQLTYLVFDFEVDLGVRVGFDVFLSQTYVALGGLTADFVAYFIGLQAEALQAGLLFQRFFMSQLTRTHIIRGDLAAAEAAWSHCALDTAKDPFTCIGSLAFVAEVELLWAKGALDKAKQKAERAIMFMKKAGQRWLLLDLLLLLARILDEQGDAEAGRVVLQEALALADPTEKRMRWQLLRMLALLSAAVGDDVGYQQWWSASEAVVNQILAQLEKDVWRDSFRSHVAAFGRRGSSSKPNHLQF